MLESQRQNRAIAYDPARSEVTLMSSEGIRFVTKEELRKLPRWACVAFAARCARRVQPLFKFGWPGAPDEHVRAVDRAIALAEESAHMGRADSLILDAARAAYAANAAARAANAAARAANAANAAARAARAAAYAANAAANAANDADADADAADAAAAARGADAAARGADAAARGAAADAAARADYELLVALSKKNRNPEATVDVALLGPLWANGEPKWWPKEDRHIGMSTAMLPSPRIAVVWDPEVVPEDDYKEIMALLGELCRAAGAVGIQPLTTGECEVPVDVGVPA